MIRWTLILVGQVRRDGLYWATMTRNRDKGRRGIEQGVRGSHNRKELAWSSTGMVGVFCMQ
ncbi:expressed unknown protein [Ectocarpus siliculosus]|uniref:Uncharacterized protein n=1 Tax=Ectocarpus siliculosus TaxID=2880 RepID=D7G4J7_ECTSI|nr:expressed unknown protein [Ectocarpus siliculosus]|eukprot:CBJ48900.1 expressed unknown protein [Ectocarpus siliculosus]